MEFPLCCLLQATAIAMEICVALVPIATIGRPHPTIRIVHGSLVSIRAEWTWTG